jgi:hypothetical protein
MMKIYVKHMDVGIALGLNIFNNSISTLAHLMHDVHSRIFNFLGKNEYKQFWKVREMCHTFMTLNVSCNPLSKTS